MAKIKISPFFFIIWLLFIIFDKSTYVLYIFLSAVIHETAHICMFFICGADIDIIEILPFGIGVRLKNSINISCLNEIICALAGPFANILYTLFLFFIPVSLHIQGTEFLICCNLALATVNLIPIMPLDGGRALYFFLSEKFDFIKAEKISHIISFIFLIPLFICAIALINITKYNFSLLLIFFYIILYILFNKNY